MEEHMKRENADNNNGWPSEKNYLFGLISAKHWLR